MDTESKCGKSAEPCVLAAWKIDALPELSELSVSEAWRLWKEICYEADYRVEVLAHEDEEIDALTERYNGVLSEIEDVMAGTEAVTLSEAIDKILLFLRVKRRDMMPFTDDDHDLRVLESAAADAMRLAPR